MDEMKLELRLGPPGVDEQDYPSTNSSLYSCVGAKRGFSATVVPKTEVLKQQHPPSLNNVGAQNNSKTRVTTPVVGWPPIGSFRKNLASTTSKRTSESPSESSKKAPIKLETNSSKGLFVKINMEGIPIGRKVDLKAYDSYEKLSLAVEELFRGLLAAQRQVQKEEAVTGLLDGSGEYTLVYEDDEGDRMLVGDDPWEMFASTAKRLRVLKSSEISTLRFGTTRREQLEKCSSYK